MPDTTNIQQPPAIKQDTAQDTAIAAPIMPDTVGLPDTVKDTQQDTTGVNPALPLNDTVDFNTTQQPAVEKQTPEPAQETTSSPQTNKPAQITTVTAGTAVDSLREVYNPANNVHHYYHIPLKKITPVKDILQVTQHKTFSVKSLDPVLRNQKGNLYGMNWLYLGLFALIALCYIWLQFFNKKYIQLFYKSVFNYRLGNKLFRESNAQVRNIMFILNIIFFISIGMFTAYGLEKYATDLYPGILLAFLSSVGIVLAMVIGKTVVLYVIGFIFNAQKSVSEYVFNNYLVNKALGIILLPINVLLAFLQIEIKTGIFISGAALIFITFIIKYIKGSQGIKNSGFHFFHIFLYFCTLEILPLAIGIRFFVSIL